MDSSLVTLLAAPHVGGKLHTFSGAFREGPEFDELDYAREVAAHLRRRVARDRSRRSRSSCDLLPQLVYHMDEPVAGPGPLPAVHRLAHGRRSR